MSRHPYIARQNYWPQNCCICGEQVVTSAGLLVTPALLTNQNNDVFHHHCAPEYDRRVQEKYDNK